MKKTFRQPVFVISIVIALIGVAAYTTGIHFLEIIELKTIDYRFATRGMKSPGKEIVLAVVDEKSLDKEGKWVWPRSKFADLVQKLSDAGVRVIGFDIGFHESEDRSVIHTIRSIQKTVQKIGINNNELENYLHQLKQEVDNDRLLSDTIKESKARVVLGWFFHSSLESLSHLDREHLKVYEENIRKSRYLYTRSDYSVDADLSYITEIEPEPNITIISNASEYGGFFNFLPDMDGSFRQIPAVLKFKNRLYAPLSLMVLSAYFEQPLHLEIGPEGQINRACIGNAICIPTDEFGRIIINYRGEDKTFRHISITDILQSNIPPSELKDKIVLVGATAVGIYDLRVTPFSTNFPGLEIHANIIDSVLSQDFIKPLPPYDLYNIFGIILTGLFLGFVLTRTGVISGALISLLTITGYSLLCIFLFSKAGGILNMVYPVLVMTLIYISVTAYKYFIEESQKRFIKNAFSTYIAPSVVKQLMDSPKKLELGGEQRDITAFFSDVQGFTGISEKLSPPDLVELLNDFLTEMTDIILRHEGTVDKFEGDAIIAFFGAPNTLENHAETATAACIEMQKRMSELRKIWRNSQKPELKMRIGLCSGPAVVGNMGSKNRMDYTMMGDTVNTAARLEGVNKTYGIYTLISESTFQAAQNRIFSREIDSINVVGKKEPITIYEPIDFRENVDDGLLHAVDWYTKGLHSYRSRDWEQAIDFFNKTLEILPDDGPSTIMIERCIHFSENPPQENWNGTFIMKTK
ncbi:MAG: adenylate/guanylate cyclase domain-containing protein [Desulfobacterales bacterium]